MNRIKTAVLLLAALSAPLTFAATPSYQLRVRAPGLKPAAPPAPVVPPSVPGAFATGYAKVTYTNSNQTISIPSSSGSAGIDVPFNSSKSSGKWYWEEQSANGSGSLSTALPGGGYYVDLTYNNRNIWGSGVAPGGLTGLSSSRTARYGFAVDATARTMTIYDVTTCTVVVNVTWTSPGAVTPIVSYRSGDNIQVTAFFAPSGKTCIPAGYSWWTV